MFSEAVSIATTALKHRRDIRKWLAQLWKRLTKGRVRIVVFGAAGAGKTSLGRLLAGEDVRPEYRESTQPETFELDGAARCTVLVPPGQKSLRAATWDDLVRQVTAGESTIIIHVVSWGLNAIEPLPVRGLEGFEEGMASEEVVRRFAERQRAQEIETLREYGAHFGNAPRTLSMLTVVTKQDLWWDHRDEVRRHYEGPYAEAVDELRQRVGAKNFVHKLWSVSLIPKNLRDGEGEVLVPTAQGYDAPLQLTNTERLIEIVAQEAEHGR